MLLGRASLGQTHLGMCTHPVLVLQFRSLAVEHDCATSSEGTHPLCIKTWQTRAHKTSMVKGGNTERYQKQEQILIWEHMTDCLEADWKKGDFFAVVFCVTPRVTTHPRVLTKPHSRCSPPPRHWRKLARRSAHPSGVSTCSCALSLGWRRQLEPLARSAGKEHSQGRMPDADGVDWSP